MLPERPASKTSHVVLHFLIPAIELSVTQGELGTHALKAEARSPDDFGEQCTVK